MLVCCVWHALSIPHVVTQSYVTNRNFKLTCHLTADAKSSQQTTSWKIAGVNSRGAEEQSIVRVRVYPAVQAEPRPPSRMSEYEEHSPLCWKPARATFVIPPGRSDHESCRPTGKAYGGPVSLVKALCASGAPLETCRKQSGDAGRL